MKASQPAITFEAHYWGAFKLISHPDEWDLYGQIPYPIARSVGFGAKVAMLYDPPSGKVFLSNHKEKPIAASTDAFFDLEKVKTWDGKESLYFDKRKSLEDLLSPEEFMITDINDPEHFDEVESYVELVEAFEKLAAGDIQFTEVKVTYVKGHEKEVLLKTDEISVEFRMFKELFDNKIVGAINMMLADHGIGAYQFATSINPDMYMVLLKLSPEKYEELDQMGLLV
jgi:hypothetical protein